MTLLIAGLVIFLGLHSLPMLPPVREALRARLGAKGYRGLFSLGAAVGLGLIIWGKSRAPLEVLWSPPGIGRSAVQWLMPLALVLVVAGNLRGYLRDRLRHPMVIGTLIWALGHLLANGDRASLLLFGSFSFWALADLLVPRQPQAPSRQPPSALHDVIAVLVGLGGFALIFHYHQLLFGLPAR